MDPGRDLKKGDLRLRLISHAERQAQAKRAEGASAKLESAFEKSLHEKLRELGYRVQPKYHIGEFEVDFLIQGEAGTKAVISCDGDRTVPEAVVLSKMERQMTLERLGWNFLRVRASEYLVDEARAMRRLVRKLGALKIEPVAEKPVDAETKAAREDLSEKIFKRADMIRSRLTAADKRPSAMHSE